MRNQKEMANSDIENVTPASDPDKNTRILIIEDESFVRNTLEFFFRKKGYQVKTAMNGMEGLEIFLHSSFDVVITDLNMPGMNGWTLTGKLKESSFNTPVILLTGEKREQVIRKSKGKRIDYFLFKPFKLAEVEDAIRLVLKKTKRRTIR